MALLGIPSLPKGTAIETQDVMLRGEEGIEEVVITELRFRWVRDLSVMVDHFHWGDSPAYYECAIVCISGLGEFHRPRALHTDVRLSLTSRLDLERYPRFTTLAGNATSIRLFRLRSTEVSEGEQRSSKLRALSREPTPQP